MKFLQRKKNNCVSFEHKQILNLFEDEVIITKNVIIKIILYYPRPQQSTSVSPVQIHWTTTSAPCTPPKALDMNLQPVTVTGPAVEPSLASPDIQTSS
jgi:hypothetical protein